MFQNEEKFVWNLIDIKKFQLFLQWEKFDSESMRYDKLRIWSH